MSNQEQIKKKRRKPTTQEVQDELQEQSIERDRTHLKKLMDATRMVERIDEELE